MILIPIILTACMENASGLPYPVAYRLSSFEDFKPGTILIGFDIHPRQTKTTQVVCAWKCLATVGCLSFNYCKSRSCQLSSGSSFSSGAAVLQNSPACSYFGMKANVSLICDERGVRKESIEDTGENLRGFSEASDQAFHMDFLNRCIYNVKRREM